MLLKTTSQGSAERLEAAFYLAFAGEAVSVNVHDAVALCGGRISPLSSYTIFDLAFHLYSHLLYRSLANVLYKQDQK